MPTIAMESLPVGSVQTNCYLVENLETRQLLIVDPGGEGERIIRAVGARTPVAVLATHGHFDHIAAVDELCEHFRIPLYLHRKDAPKLTDPSQNASQFFGESLVVHTPPTPIQEGDRLTLGGVDILVWHTPGHTSGCCCFFLPEAKGVLCGDTLFAGGYGRTDLPDGDFPALKHSLRRLYALSPALPAYPGHGEATRTGNGGREEQP